MDESTHSLTSAENIIRRRVPAMLRVRRGVIELMFLTVLYVTYSASRLIASSDFSPARGRALDLLSFERDWRISIEGWLNHLFAQVDWLGVFGSYWYATTHYVVTVVALLWLYHRSATEYVTARRALVLATVAGLVFYLLAPTAPPRLIDGRYVDILSQHADVGWWGADASAPRGFGSWTNELAAFPSLHAGWSLWVAMVLIRAGAPRLVQLLGMAYAFTMAVVVIGTGNHWILDVLVGWLLVVMAFTTTSAWQRRIPVTAHEDGWPDVRHPIEENRP